MTAATKEQHELFKELVQMFTKDPDLKMGHPTHFSVDQERLDDICWCSWRDRSLLNWTDDGYPTVTINFDPKTDQYGLCTANWPDNGDGSSCGYMELKHVFEDYDFFFEKTWPKGQDMLDLVNARQRGLYESYNVDGDRWLLLAPTSEPVTDDTTFKWVYADNGEDFDGAGEMRQRQQEKGYVLILDGNAKVGDPDAVKKVPFGDVVQRVVDFVTAGVNEKPSIPYDDVTIEMIVIPVQFTRKEIPDGFDFESLNDEVWNAIFDNAALPPMCSVGDPSDHKIEVNDYGFKIPIECRMTRAEVPVSKLVSLVKTAILFAVTQYFLGK